MTTTKALSASELAAAWLKATTPAARAKHLADAEGRAQKSGKLRWKRIAAAMKAEDREAVGYYASDWNGRKAILAARSAAKPKASKAKPKASARKAAPAKPATPPTTRAMAQAMGVDPDLLAAFLTIASKK